MKVCPNCSAQNADASTFCSQCGFDLTGMSSQASKAAGAGWKCPSCGHQNDGGGKFCIECGTRKPEGASAPTQGGSAKTQFFGAMQEAGRAKLVLIKGGGFEGVSYQLNDSQHIAGRADGFILFPDDPYCSSRHANFHYEGGTFYVTDLNSLNGVYVRIAQPLTLKAGMYVRIGEQLFRFENSAKLPDAPGVVRKDDGTYILGTPVADGEKPRLVHILQGGKVGGVYMIDKSPLTVGRDGCDLNFPGDRFISGRHAQVVQNGDRFLLEDIGSKNGTYYRIQDKTELKHSSYVFIGDQLLRVELS